MVWCNFIYLPFLPIPGRLSHMGRANRRHELPDLLAENPLFPEFVRHDQIVWYAGREAGWLHHSLLWGEFDQFNARNHEGKLTGRFLHQSVEIFR
jgi:hypothetical protein